MKYDLIAILCLAAELTGCATALKTPDNAGLLPRQPRSLYIAVQRNPRLPVEFMTVLQQESQKRLPDAVINVDEGGINDQALASADMVIALRATRIIPDYFFQPGSNTTVNGLADCLAGSGFGPGVIMAPCLYSTANDLLEASVRDSDGKTLKTYVARQEGEGWFWVLPFSVIKASLGGKTQQQIWLELIDTLYDKMLDDAVFNTGLANVARQE